MKARVEGKGPIGPLVFGPPLTFSSAPISGMGPLAGELDELIAVISRAGSTYVKFMAACGPVAKFEARLTARVVHQH